MDIEKLEKELLEVAWQRRHFYELNGKNVKDEMYDVAMFSRFNGQFSEKIVAQVLQKLCDEGIFTYKLSDDSKMKEYFIQNEIKLWKRLLELDFSLINECPKEIAEKLGLNKLKKANDQTGIFENTTHMTFRTLLQSAPSELQELMMKQWKVPQNPTYHPEGNTLKHIMTVVNRAIVKYPDNINLILAAFFHDLGKFKALGWKNGMPTQHGHEEYSAQLVEKYADWIKEQGGDVEEVYYIVKNHMKIKPNVWDVMRDKKKKVITDHPAYPNLQTFGTIDKGGLQVESLNESADFDAKFDPTMAGAIVDKNKIGTFMFAGKAIFTIRNNQTMNRFTFRIVQLKNNPNVHFVSVMTHGNEHSNFHRYSFFGTIFDQCRFRYSKKADKQQVPMIPFVKDGQQQFDKSGNALKEHQQSIKVWYWFWKTLMSDQDFPPQIQIWHEGVCGKCGKSLTVPKSIEIGLGPHCAKSAQPWERSAKLVQANNAIGIFDESVSYIFEKMSNDYSIFKDLYPNGFIVKPGEGSPNEKGGFRFGNEFYDILIQQNEWGKYEISVHHEDDTDVDEEGNINFNIDGRDLTFAEVIDFIEKHYEIEPVRWVTSDKLRDTNQKTGLFEHIKNFETYSTIDDDIKIFWMRNFQEFVNEELVLTVYQNNDILGGGEDEVHRYDNEIDLVDAAKKFFKGFPEADYLTVNDKFSGRLLLKLERQIENVYESLSVDEFEELLIGQKFKNVADYIEVFKYESYYGLGEKEILNVKIFQGKGDKLTDPEIKSPFAQAEEYCEKLGYSISRHQAGAPLGLMHGEYDIQKWRNLDKEDKERLDGLIVQLDVERNGSGDLVSETYAVIFFDYKKGFSAALAMGL